MVNSSKINLSIVCPPSSHSVYFKNFCTNKIMNHHNDAYLNYLFNILDKIYPITIEDGLCCLIFLNRLTELPTTTYSNLLSKYVPIKKKTWNFYDEIILTNSDDQPIGKIAVLKKGNKLEVISRAERLSYISIPQDEKDMIIDSIWKIDNENSSIVPEKITTWLMLSYSNVQEKIYDPFPKISKTKKISAALHREFIG